LDGLEHQLPLGRQPVASCPEHALPVAHAGSLCFDRLTVRSPHG
jgi:hypothetical protein